MTTRRMGYIFNAEGVIGPMLAKCDAASQEGAMFDQ